MIPKFQMSAFNDADTKHLEFRILQMIVIPTWSLASICLRGASPKHFPVDAITPMKHVKKIPNICQTTPLNLSPKLNETQGCYIYTGSATKPFGLLDWTDVDSISNI